MQTSKRIWFLIVAMIAVLAASAPAQESRLGKVEFETSGSAKAQAHFLRGLAALHSFWFEEALEAFRESTKIEPDFMMGYWGEAMAQNHPLWSEQDTPAARLVIEKIKDTPKLTARGYLNAVTARRRRRTCAHLASAAMQQVRDYPGDLDAAAFTLFCVLAWSTVRIGYRLRHRPSDQRVYQKNPSSRRRALHHSRFR